jgi:hypothetical protein
MGFRGRRPKNLGQYIEASQNSQADVLAEYAKSLRLSPRAIGGYYQFHFIDVLPANWPKSIVSHDLRPKRAYYEMAQVNQPVVPLFQIKDKGNAMDIWVANDLPEALRNCRVAWTIEGDGRVLQDGKVDADVRPLDATLVKTIDLAAVPQSAPVVHIALTLADAVGKPVSHYHREVFLKAWRTQEELLKEFHNTAN